MQSRKKIFVGISMYIRNKRIPNSFNKICKKEYFYYKDDIKEKKKLVIKVRAKLEQNLYEKYLA